MWSVTCQTINSHNHNDVDMENALMDLIRLISSLTMSRLRRYAITQLITEHAIWHQQIDSKGRAWRSHLFLLWIIFPIFPQKILMNAFTFHAYISYPYLSLSAHKRITSVHYAANDLFTYLNFFITIFWCYRIAHINFEFGSARKAPQIWCHFLCQRRSSFARIPFAFI